VLFQPTYDWDLWWHLRTGAVALEQRSTLPVDPFSYSHAGAAWPYKDLAADVVLAAGFARLGFWFLGLMRVLALGLLVRGLWGAMRRHERHGIPLVLGAAAIVAAVGVDERPNQLSYVAFVALLALLDAARARLSAGGVRAVARVLGPPVVLVWAWGWVHRGAVLGPVVLAGFAAWLTLSRALGRTRLAPLLERAPGPAVIAGAWLAAAAAAAALVLNPSGTGLWRTALAVTGSAAFRQQISNWQRLGVAELWRAFPATLVVGAVVVVALVARLWRAQRRGEADAAVSLWHLGLLGVAAAAVADSVRWVPYLGLAAIACGVRLGAEALAGAGRGGARPLPRGLGGLAAAVGVAVVALTRPFPYELGERADRFPAGAVAFARGQGLRGPVANAFDFGGYLIHGLWPDAKVLVDGRNDTVYPPAFVSRCFRAEWDPEAFAAMRREDGATWVVARNQPGDSSHRYLAADPEWAMVYWSEPAVVWVRRAAWPGLDAHVFRFVSPAAVDASVFGAVQRSGGDVATLAAVEREVQRLVAASPTSVRAHVAQVVYYHALGPGARGQRDAAFARLQALAGDQPVVRELAARLTRH
jgi:hypothetical protein